MSLELTPEQAELAGVVRDFARERVAPRAEEMNARGEFPYDLVAAMGAMGLFGLPFPEEYGGMGGDLLSLCVAIEEIGRVDQSLGVTLEAAVGLGAMPIFRYGTADQRERWLPALARGERLAAFGLTEAGGGTDAGAMQTTAVRDGDQWVVDGTKQFITNAGTDITSVVTVAAVTAEAAGRRQVTTIIVPTGTPGYTVGAGYRKVGWHASDTRDLSFDSARVPADHQLGEVGRGLANLLAVLDEGRVAIAALAVGLIQGCIDACVAYAREREAFGRPIGANQAVAFAIADMEASAHLARTQYRHAARLAAAGRPFSTEASIAKLYATEAAVTAARAACQVFGGYGFTTEYPVGRFYQDAKILEIGEGTSEVQRLLIARSLGLPV